MNDKAEDTVVDGVRLTLGGIYLRDKRNGRVYQYEDTLSNMGYIERFEYDGTLPGKDSAGFTKLNLTGLEKAADWDKLASMKPADREAELKRREEYAAGQKKLSDKVEAALLEADAYSDAEITLIDKKGPTLEAYHQAKWTNALLLEKNLATKK